MHTLECQQAVAHLLHQLRQLFAALRHGRVGEHPAVERAACVKVRQVQVAVGVGKGVARSTVEQGVAGAIFPRDGQHAGLRYDGVQHQAFVVQRVGQLAQFAYVHSSRVRLEVHIHGYDFAQQVALVLPCGMQCLLFELANLRPYAVVCFLLVLHQEVNAFQQLGRTLPVVCLTPRRQHATQAPQENQEGSHSSGR